MGLLIRSKIKSYLGGRMIQTKVSITVKQQEFINNYKSYGFKNKSSMFRRALDLLIAEYKKKQLEKSAKLYAEIYSKDNELQVLTNSAVGEWPE
ncbi:MAG: hypothetical protein PWQ09_1338 [Candidatus Cloacimonadota bacterium]|nr:hypothetical protein [Candidatus Cloacimonadota bacterium]